MTRPRWPSPGPREAPARERAQKHIGLSDDLYALEEERAMDTRRKASIRMVREARTVRGDVVRRPTRRRWTLYVGLGCLAVAAVVGVVVLS